METFPKLVYIFGAISEKNSDCSSFAKIDKIWEREREKQRSEKGRERRGEIGLET